MKLNRVIFLFLCLLFSIVKAQEPNPDIALSLARVMVDQKVSIIQVNAINEFRIEGVNLSEQFHNETSDVFEFVETTGYDNIVAGLTRNPEKQSFSAQQVLTPVIATTNTIAGATNYPEHKEETGIKIDPVLFPKITGLSPYVSSVNVQSDQELLDYEVELAVVYSKNIYKPEDLDNQLLGFMVAIDYSERASMLRVYDPDRPELAIGFTDSKSHEGYFPVGPIIVIPRNWKTYYPNLAIQLWRNDEIKQSDQLNSMIWDVRKITEEALRLGNRELWEFNGKSISLLPQGYIAKGTIAITGTPGGVVFEPPTTPYIVKKAIEYGFLLRFFTWNPKDYVIDRYINKQLRQEQFLTGNEGIKAHIQNLGYIYSTIKSNK